MAERQELRFKTLRNISSAVSERTRPLWMLALLSTGSLAIIGIPIGAEYLYPSAVGYGAEVVTDKFANPDNKLGRKKVPTVASDLRDALAMPGRLIGKIRRW